MKISNCLAFIKAILTRASTVGTATSVAFVAEEYMVAIKSLHISSQAAYTDIRLLSSYIILITAFIEPIAEVVIDKFQFLSTLKKAKSLARLWYALLDITYTDCICLYFFDTFNHKSGLSYWYAVVIPALLIALICNKEFRAALHLLPTANSGRLHKSFTTLLDVSCEAIKGCVLGYDVMSELGYELPAINSIGFSSGFSLIYGLFHSAVYYLKQTPSDSISLDRLDIIFQTLFSLLTTVLFSLYIKAAMADVEPHRAIQLVAYGIILTYIFIRPCLGPKHQPLLDEVAEEEEETPQQREHNSSL